MPLLIQLLVYCLLCTTLVRSMLKHPMRLLPGILLHPRIRAKLENVQRKCVVLWDKAYESILVRRVLSILYSKLRNLIAPFLMNAFYNKTSCSSISDHISTLEPTTTIRNYSTFMINQNFKVFTQQDRLCCQCYLRGHWLFK